MAAIVSRVLSVIVVIIYVVAAILNGATAALPMLALFLALPMVCIWMPDVMGSLPSARGIPLGETPPFLVVLGGWILLLLPAVLHFTQG